MLNRPRTYPATFNILVTLSLVIVSILLPSPALADSTITVATNTDTIAPDGLCSLREAILNADNDALTYNDCVIGSGNDTIQFNDALGTTTITLGSTLPDITDSNGLTINGGGDVTISGDNNVRVLYITSSGVLILQNITVTKGEGNLGGGALNEGMLTVTNSTFSGNVSLAGAGGGLANNLSGTAIITKSTFLDNSTIAGDGGGIGNYGIVTIANSTISNNSAGGGGGGLMNNSGTATILNSTFSNNTVTYDGGGVMTWKGSSADPTTTIRNTIIVNSSLGYDDCVNYPTGNLSGGNNIIKQTSSCSGITSLTSDPNLGTLTGSPAYYPLLAGSLAIDAGSDPICTAAPVSNTSQNGVPRPQSLHCDIGSYEYPVPIFADVPYSYWANSFIERLYSAGITGGCSASPLNYCPENTVTRDQMAIFLERGIQGSSFVPPNVSPTFGDTAGNFAEDWIEALKNDGITGGCGNGNYCPTSGVTRAQMAIFLERAMHGSSFAPPNVAPSFSDTAGNFAEDWIEALKNDGITSGCGNGNYCPDGVVTRAQMAIFLVKAFNLP